MNELTNLNKLIRNRTERWTVSSFKPVSYEVQLHRDVFSINDPYLAESIMATKSGKAEAKSSRRLIVIDSTVEELYGEKIRNYFEFYNIEAHYVALKSDEIQKTWENTHNVLNAMDKFAIDRRREPVVAIGGGVLCDIVGFAASIYRRGTPYIRIPTTLVGIVDAGVGVKTGVNHLAGKNRIGTYYQPQLSILDTSFLGTVSERHLANGMAEILKVALVKSERLFNQIELASQCKLTTVFTDSNHSMASDYIVSESINLMLEELQPNLWEAVLERCVDYGHTISPVIEMMALPELLHGEAVAIDMALTTGIAVSRGMMERSQGGRVLDVMLALGLDPWVDLIADINILKNAIEDATRHRDGLQRIPLTPGIGSHTFVNDVTEDDLRCGVDFIRQHVSSYTARVAV